MPKAQQSPPLSPITKTSAGTYNVIKDFILSQEMWKLLAVGTKSRLLFKQ